MLGRGAGVALFLCAITLAGCIGGSNNNNNPLNATNTNSTGLSDNATSAPNGAGKIEAFNETNKTETTGVGSMMHTHDYWNGRERIDVDYLDGGLIPFPLFSCRKPDNSCTTGSTTPSPDGSGDTYPVGSAIADFDMPAPPKAGMIYEGTKEVDFTLNKLTGPNQCGLPSIDCTPDTPANPLGAVYLDYLAANDEPGHFHHAGQLQLGQTLKIQISPLDADMPHQTKSLWIFRVYSNSEMVWFNFNITVTVIRGYPVVNWPPHPDLYADHPQRVVFDGPVKLQSKGTIDSNLWGSDAGWVHPDKVISWGTDSVAITVTNVQFTSDTGAPITPTGWVFEYNNASKPPLLGNGAQYSGRLKDAGSDGKTYHFTIDLTKDDGQAYDTPYAQYSRWGFRLVPQFDEGQSVCPDDPFLQEFLVGCQFVPWTVTYNMQIVASGHSIANGFTPAM